MIWIFKIFIYFSICVAVENVISGIWRMFFSDVFTSDQKKQGISWSYIYMFPVYLIFPITLELIMSTYSHFFIIWMFLLDFIMGFVGITLIESLFGWIYEKTYPGYCPWGKYTYAQRGIEFLGGYSRWDYSLGFGGFAIVFHLFTIWFNGIVSI